MQKPKRVTVKSPWVDLADWVRRLAFDNDNDEVNLVCQDTGVVVYCTPTYAWGGNRYSIPAAEARAKRWLKRHGFTQNLSDHGYFTRTTDSVIKDPAAVIAAFRKVL